MRMKTKKTDWESIIRQAIENSGLTRYEISKQCGVSQAQLCRFMAGQRTITLPTAEKIAQIVGLELLKKSK